MTAEFERRALMVFEVMLQQPEAVREAWLEREAAGDNALLSRVRAMRDADRLAALGTGAALDHAEEEVPPERIGAYRIVERIGSGGMGSVYRGERDTGDFAHVVAIKVIKPGLLSAGLIERFQRERSILAGLRHPGIAQLHDGGETESGSPFIIMEFVEGRPLLQWRDEDTPSLGERRRVFATMCSAVAFAHRNLIVHRDLTPSNVLVTDDAKSGWGVKLIDFGIARPADVLADQGIDPERASIVSLSLTPGYAAPERMRGGAVTTSADIYSLGRLLEKLMPPGSADRELRAVIARATAPEPQDRYPTVEALGDDVAAMGDGRPVAAMAGGGGYRLRKFLERYRWQTTAAGFVLVALVTALVLTTAAYRRAEVARAAEAARFAELRSLASYLLFDLNDRLERTVGNTAARADLARQAQGYLSSLARSPHADPQIRYEAAVGLIKLARIQGVPSEPNLGDRKSARANLETAERLLTGLHGETGVAPDAALAEAGALQSVIAVHGESDPAGGARLLAAARIALDRAPNQDGPAWRHARRTVRKAELEHADLGEKTKDLATLAEALEADIARWPAATRDSWDARLDRGYADYYRGLARLLAGEKDNGLPQFLEAERRFDALLAARPNDPTVLFMQSYNRLIGMQSASQLGKEDVSARMILAAKALIDQLVRLEPNDDAVQALSANITEGLSQNLRDHDRFAEAIAMQRQVVAGRRRAADKGSPRAEANLGFSLGVLGVIARDARDRPLACASWKEAEARFAALDRRKQLLGFHAAFLPGLRANLTVCSANGPWSAFGPLRR